MACVLICIPPCNQRHAGGKRTAALQDGWCSGIAVRMLGSLTCPCMAPKASRSNLNRLASATYATVSPDGSLRSEWAVDASDALPARLPPGLFQ